MKHTNVFLSILLFTYSQALAQVTCDNFAINSELTSEELIVSLNTDLPNNTILIVSVNRSYWEKGSGDEYSIDYFWEKSTVGEWINKRTIMIDNSKWETDLQNKQKKLAPLGLGFDVDKISDNVVVSVVVPINQLNPKFGKGNSNLSGKKVDTTGFRTVSDKNSFNYPLGGSAAKKVKFGNPLDLNIGDVFTISKSTPLMAEFEPSDSMKALGGTKYIQTENLIKVVSIRKKSNKPWYEVEVFNNDDKLVGKGWINSQALMGQSLRIEN